MPTHLSRLFQGRRLEQRLGLRQLARQCDYINLTKGARRIQRFEGGGMSVPDLLQKLAIVLDISDEEIHRGIQADKVEWEQWADEPIEPQLIARLCAAAYSHKSIPPDLCTDREAMEHFASEFAKEKQIKVCLVLSRRLRVWFDRDGRRQGETKNTFENTDAAYMGLGVSGKKYLLSLPDN